MSQRSSEFVDVMEKNVLFKYPAKYFRSPGKAHLMSKIFFMILALIWVFAIVKFITTGS